MGVLFVEISLISQFYALTLKSYFCFVFLFFFCFLSDSILDVKLNVK